MEGLKSRGVSGSSGFSSEDDYWWDNPSLSMEFIQKKDIFVSFLLDSFVCKSIADICKFNKLYFDVWIRMERWGAIVWDALGTKYVGFKAGIAMALWLGT